MKKRLINSQLNNLATYKMYLRQCMTLAENVFEIGNLPEFIDTAYFYKTLTNNGAIAFFVDEVMGLLCLPFTTIGNLDVYGRPLKIQVIGQNGYSRILDRDEFVIMYDNNGRYPLFADIKQYCERLAMLTRVIDVNITQQKTPRIFKCNSDDEQSIKALINEIDGNVNTVVTYDSLDLNDISVINAPAPYVADKINESKQEIWNEFLRLIGVSNANFQKKERNIKDEVLASQGGTIASRFSRFEPRQKAVNEINKKFGAYLEKELYVKYYDGLPTSLKEVEENFDNESEVIENDI